MPLTALEWIVTIFAILGIIKFIVILIKKEKWWPITRSVYGNPQIFSWVFLVLAAVIFYFLIQEFTIVEILAVAAFFMLLMAFGFTTYSKEVLELAQKIMKKGFSWGQWLVILIWAVLLLWALYEIFL